MRTDDLLSTFVRDALMSGKSRAEIRDALTDAGWTEHETASAISAWADTGFTPPVPRPRAYVSARDAFFYALMFTALVMTTWNLTALAFTLYDIWLPDQLDDRRFLSYNYSRIRWSIAALIVFAPLFLYLWNRGQKSMRTNPSEQRSVLRKVFVYLTLFIAATVLLGDLTALIYNFLNGDLVPRLLAKLVTLGVVASSVFLFFRGEADDKAA